MEKVHSCMKDHKEICGNYKDIKRRKFRVDCVANARLCENYDEEHS